MFGETGFEPATLCSQITRLSFGLNRVCQVSPSVPPYSPQRVSASVTTRRGVFSIKKGNGPGEGTATKGMCHAETTRRMCTIFPPGVQPLIRGRGLPPLWGRSVATDPYMRRPRWAAPVESGLYPGANFARKGFPSARILEAELRDNQPIPYPNLLAA